MLSDFLALFSVVFSVLSAVLLVGLLSYRKVFMAQPHGVNSGLVLVNFACCGLVLYTVKESCVG